MPDEETRGVEEGRMRHVVVRSVAYDSWVGIITGKDDFGLLLSVDFQRHNQYTDNKYYSLHVKLVCFHIIIFSLQASDYFASNLPACQPLLG